MPKQTRSNVVVRRTYARPLDKKETKFETWEDIALRVKDHQKWLWERAKGSKLNKAELTELDDFIQLLIEKKLSTSGRTLWLGGTDVAKRREASQFNCAHLSIETVYDVVDALWLLMQGCGVGFTPIIGTLNGFFQPIPKVTVIRTERLIKGGNENNEELWDEKTKVWTIKVGDSAEAWAKSIGKLLAGKKPAKELVFDFSELRPAGDRLKGYGWISSGDEAISTAYVAIAEVMNRKAGQLLTRMDILDLLNWLGTILSSRRSAQIALFEYKKPEWADFAVAKKDYWMHNNEHRTQSNNSLVFYTKPSRPELVDIFNIMAAAGGSEPGFVNGGAALTRAPWFKGSNPCCEILLANKSFCNLVETDISKFRGDAVGLHRAIRLAARANYRQTLVNLKDGILQEAWHLNNEFLRLCGVSITGVVQRDDLEPYDIQSLKNTAIYGAYSMADELGLQRPKNVTTIKPSGTLSKVFGCQEGIHKSLGKYMFNHINFGKHDPLLPMLAAAGYEVYDNPDKPTEGTLVKFPVCWDDVEFDTATQLDGTVVEVNLESAITQLDRYKKYQIHWCQQNVSNTISYSPEEVPDIIDWLLLNWEHYVGVSFLYRDDPTKTAKDLGYNYMPQEVTTKEKYDAYVKGLSEVDLDSVEDSLDHEMESQECSGGSCPVV